MKEQDLKKTTIEWLNYNGFFAFPTNTGVFFLKGAGGKTRMFKSGIKGCADILAYKNGMSYAIELKVGKNKPTPEQIEFLREVNRHGCIGFVAWSLDEVIHRLEHLT